MALKPYGSIPGLISLLLFYSVQVSSLSISFCSSQNTGNNFGPTYNQFQSNGACQTTCQQSFAYAVLQDSNCWCSNYAPADQTDTGSCDITCPGFPTEQCGNKGAGLFGYYQLGQVQPSGTAGAAASTTPSAAAPSSSPQESPPSPSTITVQATVTDKPNPSISVSVIVSTVSQSSLNPPASPQSSSPPSISSPAPPESSTPPPTTSSPPLQASQPSWTPTPSAVVTTVLGSIQTVIITPTLPPATAQTQVTTVNGTAMPDSFWSNTGKVAGTFTVVGIVVLALIGALVWLIVRRTRTRESMAITSTDGDNGSVTQMPFGAEKRNSKLTLTTAGLSGMRREGSNGKSTSENTPASMSRRTSMPLVHDQRLDPRALYNIENANASHVSVGSFRDDRDYSRPVLHVRNPD